jgi:hypothetical protein
VPECVPIVIVDHLFIAWFDQHQAELTDRTRSLLDAMLAMGRNDDVRFVLRGSTDTSETGPGDRGLALRRAEAVQRYLEQRGIASERMVTRDVGERRLVPTEPGTPEAQNRSVTIEPHGLGQAERAARVRACARWLGDHCVGKAPEQMDPDCGQVLRYLGRFGQDW